MSIAVIQRETAQAAPPDCLFENPYRLVSLWKVLKFHADEFCRACGQIGQIGMEIRCGSTPRSETVGIVSASFRVIAKHATELKLAATLAQMKRVEAYIRDGRDFSYEVFGRELIEVYSRIVDELEARHCMLWTQQKTSILFPIDVGQRFCH